MLHRHRSMALGIQGFSVVGMFIIGESGLVVHHSKVIKQQWGHSIASLVPRPYRFGKLSSSLHRKMDDRMTQHNCYHMKDMEVNFTH